MNYDPQKANEENADEAQSLQDAPEFKRRFKKEVWPWDRPENEAMDKDTQ